MATITSVKNVRTLLASTSNAAGATTNSAEWDLGTTVGDQTLEVVMTNGATGPTIAPSATVQLSRDGGSAFISTNLVRAGLTTASGVARHLIIIPQGINSMRVQFAGNTGQAVTVEAYGHEVTSLASV